MITIITKIMENIEITNQNDELHGLKSNRINQPNYQRNFLVNCLFNLVNIRGFTLLMFVTALLIVSLIITYNHLSSVRITDCYQLEIYRNHSFQSMDCADGCNRCEIHHELQKCLECFEDKVLFNAACFDQCPDTFQPFKQQCIPSQYNATKLQIQKHNGTLIDKFQYSYLVHGNEGNSSSLIFVFHNKIFDLQFNWQKISEKTAASVIELSIAEELSDNYDKACGRNLYSQFFLSEILTEIIKTLKMKLITTILLVGVEDTSEEVFELQTHIYQVFQLVSKVKFQSDYPQYNKYGWRKFLSKDFAIAALGFNSTFTNEVFREDQVALPYRWSDNLVINIKSNHNFGSETILVENITEEYVIEFMNSIYRQQEMCSDCE